MMNQSLRTLDQAIDWLFPQRCQGCEQKIKSHHAGLCLFCWEQVFKPQRVIFPSRSQCHIFSAGIYEDVLKRMVILAKFKHHPSSIEILIELVIKTFALIPHSIDVITCVPSDFWRSFVRGVDLPATLAFELSKQTKIPFDPTLLLRLKRAPRQAKLERKKRLTNTKRVFKASKSVARKKVLVIDDIITTGSTILSIDRILQRQKPGNTVFLTCAKTP